MPNLDGTGPANMRPRRLGLRSRRSGGNQSLGSRKCTCPNCGYEIDHQPGVPCIQIKCPKCQTLMRGSNCS